MLERGEQCGGRELVTEHSERQARKGAGRRGGERLAGRIVDLDVPAPQFGGDAARQIAVGRNQRRALAFVIDRFTQHQRDGARFFQRPRGFETQDIGQRQGRIRQIAQLSQDLDAKDQDLDRANKKVLEYAKEKEAIADRFLKLCWAVGILVGLYFLGQVLQFLANFNPAFQNAANLVNTFVSPVLHSGFHKARQALAGAPR